MYTDRPGGVGSGCGRPILIGCVIEGIMVGAPKLCIVFDDAITCQPNTQTHTPKLYTFMVLQTNKSKFIIMFSSSSFIVSRAC